VTTLETSQGGKVYIVGTAHFSEESNRDVAETIRKVRPHVVVLELCQSRLSILSLDEKTLLEDSKNLNMEKIMQNIREQGVVQGVMYTLLLSLSAHLTRELGMAPGGEFRTAFAEAQRIPGCCVQLGDRPVHLTLRRAFASLNPWQKFKLGCSIMFSRETITKEEVEKCKDRDLLEGMLQDITGQYPQLSRVLVDERDLFLAYSLQLAASTFADIRAPDQPLPTRVVGVVGIGHVPGIIRNWGNVKDEDIPPLLQIPKQSLLSYLILRSIRLSVTGLFAFTVYRYLVPQSIKTACSSSMALAWTTVNSIIRR
jgi:pheromone shutdown protein TraB